MAPHGYRLVPLPGAAEADLDELDAIVTSTATHYSVEIINAAPRLRLLVSPIVGVDTIDIEAATRRGVLVANCPAPENVIGMAEATVMLIVATQLNLRRKEASLRAGRFMPPHDSRLLWGKTVGFIGYGRIARQVEQRLAGWGVTTQHYDPLSPNSITLAHLARTSDVVSVHVTLTEQTRLLVDAGVLASMKPDAVLVNTARGGVVDEAALAAAIDAGQLRGCAVDVFANEPIEPGNPLLRCDPERVILTPHSIGHNAETGPSTVAMLLAALEAAASGRAPENVLNPDVVADWRERWSQ